MNAFARLIFCLMLLALFSGCATPQEKQADSAVNSYFYGNYARAAEKLRPLAEETNENFVLNNLRLGSTALARYDLDEAEQSFLRAYEVINSYGVNDGGRSLGATLVAEKIKVWKGEPYERAMANFYLGMIYYMRQDYGNARGAFENALFKLRDYADEKKAKKDDYREVESNFAVAAIMLGKCWQKLDREDLARANFDRAVQIRPELKAIADYDRNLKSNMLLIVEMGHAPEKVTDFDGAIVAFRPMPNQVPPPPVARVRVDGRTVDRGDDGGLGLPIIDTIVMAQDKRWEDIDTIRAVKGGLGTGLLVGGAVLGTKGLNESGSAQRRDLTTAAALAAAGLLLKASAQADVRQWEMLPRSVYIIPLTVAPGRHNVLVDFPSMPGLQQEWVNLVAPDVGEASYFIHMKRYEPGPFYWPPGSPSDDADPTSEEMQSQRRKARKDSRSHF